MSSLCRGLRLYPSFQFSLDFFVKTNFIAKCRENYIMSVLIHKICVYNSKTLRGKNVPL